LARSPWAPGAPALAGAARVLQAVTERGLSADAALKDAESSAVRAIALGSIRWYLRLAPALAPLLSRPRAVTPTVRSLLVVGAHQVEYSRNAPEATVHACVDAARILRAERAAGFVNAVLRRFVSERTSLFASVDADLPARTAHPAWLVARLLEAWPDEAIALLEANNAHPPMMLRVDETRISAEDYLGRLSAASIESHKIQWLRSGIVLDRPVSVSELPGFTEGLVSVQDAGAQLAAGLLDPRPRQRVLDACAAPGGKTGALLEQGVGIELTAVDVDGERAGLVRENLARLGREARVVVADVREPAGFWDGEPYERILVDAPCSSTGVIRRHPDIKLLRRPTDTAAFAAQQQEILRAAVRLLAPGGRLVYCTCSVLPEENERVVNRLLGEEPAMAVAQMPRAAALAPGAVERMPGVQLLPGREAGTDGFYYACLEKTTTGT
jgi:16S rRNA (cytosine967-C5)-methyltransferase